MSGRRGSGARRKLDGFTLPAGAPAFCQPLDGMDEAEARDLIEPGKRYTIGPAEILNKGRWCAVVECDGEGRPFRVLDGADAVRGVTASWDAAARLMVALAVEHEADAAQAAGALR